MGGFDTAYFFGAILAFIFGSAFARGCQAFVAAWLGDRLPASEGRLSFSPRRQHEPLGLFLALFISLLVPLISWAKPLNLNPFANRLRRKGGALVAITGPLAQILLGLVVGFALRLFLGNTSVSSNVFVETVGWFVFFNFLFAAFQVLPLPPLDGYGVLKNLLSPQWDIKLQWMETYGPVLVLAALFLLSFLGNPHYRFVFFPIANSLMGLVGLSLSL